MLAWFHRLRPRRLILIGAILLGLSGGLAVVLDQMRRISPEESQRLRIKYDLDDWRAQDRSKRLSRMIDEEGLGIYGWTLPPRWHRAYTQLDVAAFLAGLTLVGLGALRSSAERRRRLSAL